MSKEFTPEQIARGTKFGNWLMASCFWLALAPTIFFAGMQFISMPIRLILIGFKISPDSMELASWLIAVPSYGFGGWLVWLVWKQAQGYFVNRAE